MPSNMINYVGLGISDMAAMIWNIVDMLSSPSDRVNRDL